MSSSSTTELAPPDPGALREDSAPSQVTFVGLGPNFDQPPDGSTLPPIIGAPDIEKKTLVGLAAPSSPASSDAPPLLDAEDDADTVVGNYDEVTVVAMSPLPSMRVSKAPPPPSASRRPRLPSQPPDTDPDPASQPDAETAPLVLLTTADPAPFADEDWEEETRALLTVRPAAPKSSARRAGGSELDDAPEAEAEDEPVRAALSAPASVPRFETPPPPSLADLEPELKLFPPSLDSLVPPAPRSRDAISFAETLTSGSHVQSDAPWFTSVDTDVPGRPPSAGRSYLRLAAYAAAAAAIVAVVLLLLPRTGKVLISVAGPLDAAVPAAEVFVDGKPACSPAPCRATLDKGSHVVTVSAPGYRRSAEKSLVVAGGSEEALHFTLAPIDSAGADIRVPVTGLRVFLDGKDRGAAPVTLRGLAPGRHRLQLAGHRLYAPWEKEIELEPDRLIVVEPKLALVPGILSISAAPGLDDITVEISGNGKDVEVRELPARLQVEPIGSYRIRAVRKGTIEYEKVVDFADQNPLQNVRIELGAPTPPPAPVAAPAPAPSISPLLAQALAKHSSASVAPARVDLDSADGATPGATASLNIVSTPPSNVVLDGRPLGPTPLKVAVPPGPHSVVFVHAQKGRKSVRVNTAPGKSTTASVDF